MRVSAVHMDSRTYLNIAAEYQHEMPALRALANQLVGPLDDGWTMFSVEVLTPERQDEVFDCGYANGRGDVYEKHFLSG